MIKECENKNLLQRDGTSQQQRLLKALLPTYVSVDERSMQDLVEFTNKLAEQINYYNSNNTTDGNWESFFIDQQLDEVTQKTQPHYALFIAFLELFRFAQDDLNTITQRHLDFYYREVLKIEEKPEMPDQTFVIFELARQVTTALIQKDTNLNAGKDKSGEDLVYKTEKNLVVNTSQAVEFKSVFYNKNNDGRLYASPVSNSSNGLGAPIESEEPKWKTFGTVSDPLAPFNSPLANRPQAEIGFAFASPVLKLAEGNRNVKIVLSVTNLFGITNADLQTAFKVLFSGEEAWIEPLNSSTKLPQDTTYVNIAAKTITIQRTLTEAQKAIVSYAPDVLLDPIETTYPVVKIVLNTANTSSPYIYEKFKKLVINKAEITVDVDGVKNLIVQNDQSKLDASKPFMPFGNKPLLSSSFYIGSNEIFSKQLTSVDLNITWKGLPDTNNGFLGYYHHYLPVAENNLRRNANFKAEISILEGRVWKTLIPSSFSQARLFDPSSNTALNDFRFISISNSALSTIPPDPNLPVVTKFDNTTLRGFMKLELAAIDFGHSDYQVSFATQAIKASQSTPEAYPLLNEPYTPLISEISLNYTSKVTINLVNTPAVNNETSFKSRINQFFNVFPFGVAEAHPFILKTNPFVSVFPVFTDEGNLYIGIQNMIVPQTLSVLFKVAEGSENPDLPKQNVIWSYLSENEWYEFPKSNILSDSTDGLITSGIIEFVIPKKASADNTILTNGLHWIKGSVINNSGAICDMISIQTQAVTSVFSNNGNDPEHLSESLPAESITALVNGNSSIKSVNQPYASFGGRMTETSDAFYTRVSERLRHKNRAIMIWDYEHLILEAYPTIFKVKCLNHTRYISSTDIEEVSPGNVSIVVVSNLLNKNAVNPLQPKTSLFTLNSINEFVKKINPPCATVYVKNPIYEEIIVHFNVRLKSGFDAGFYLNLLNEDLKKFLSPWAFSEQEIFFGGRIHASVIVNFIEERNYVDYVTCFTMDQITGTGVKKDIKEAVASTGASILTSVPAHEIFLLETDDCECDDNIVTRPNTDDSCGCDEQESPIKPVFGVGASNIGGNFIIGNGLQFGSDGIDGMGIQNDFEVQ